MPILINIQACKHLNRSNAAQTTMGGEESIALMGKSQLSVTSLCYYPHLETASRTRRQCRQTNCHAEKAWYTLIQKCFTLDENK